MKKKKKETKRRKAYRRLPGSSKKGQCDVCTWESVWEEDGYEYCKRHSPIFR